MDAKCTCNHCFGHLGFDAEHAGETIQCPHCGMETVLFIPEVVRRSLPQVETVPPPNPELKTARIVEQTASKSVGADWRLKQIGVAVLIATVAACVVASVLRNAAWNEQADRRMEERAALPTGSTAAQLEEIKSRRESSEGRSREEVAMQRIAWAAEDARKRDKEEAARKERQRDAESAMERNYYWHFALTWLVTMGVSLAVGRRAA